MDTRFDSAALADVTTELLAVPVFQDTVDNGEAFSTLNRASNGLFSAMASEQAFTGKRDQVLHLTAPTGTQARHVIIVGLGGRESFEVVDCRRFGAVIAKQAKSLRATACAVALPQLDGAESRTVQLLVEGVRLGDYRFAQYLSEDESTQLKSLSILLEGGPQLAISRGHLVADATCLARDLVNLPARDLTPKALAERAEAIAGDDLECKILGPKECAKLNMGLFLAVAQGSVEKPRFIHLTYKPKGKAKPRRKIALVGKGVTFDSGGLSLKPSASMLDMKADMAGAATVLGVASTLTALNLPIEVHVIVAAAENMLSGSSYRLGDVIRGASGTSVEIVNTDAEGRLTLADALHYAVGFEPDEILDFATLTGACMVALGPHIAGIMGNENALVEHVLAAGRRAGEPLWRLPLSEPLAKQLESPIADLKNAGERWGGAITAGLFLKRFVGDLPWVHLDIAGPSYADKPWSYVSQGGTGFGVATTIEHLSSYV